MRTFAKGAVFAVVLTSTSLLSPSTEAVDTSPTGDSMFYYKLGGGRVFRAVPRWETTTINISFSASVTGMSCGNFDPKVTLSNTLNDVKDGFEDMYNQMENAAGAAISNLPGYILSKVNPNLYDIFMNAIAQAQAKFKLATKSCEMIESEIRNGQDPFEEFATFSYGDTWEAGLGTGGADATDVHEQAKSATDNGVIHPCHGRAGGKNQPNYEVIGDTASIGYNRLIERDKCSVASLVVGPTTVPLVKKFNSPQKVREWVNIVVGEVSVDIDDLGQPSTTPGAGLLPLINRKKTDVYDDLVDMFNGSEPLSLDNLNKVSAPGILITAQVITSLRYLSDREAQIFIERIADEVAVSDVIDSALLVRRTLATGMKETDSYRLQAVVKHATKSIEEIDAEIDLVMKENEVRKKLLGESIPLLLNMTRAKELNSLKESPVHHSNKHLLEQGRIKN